MHDGLKDELVGHIVHTLLERNINTVASSTPSPGLVHVTGSGEEVSVFVKGYGHYSVRQIKRFLVYEHLLK